MKRLSYFLCFFSVLFSSGLSLSAYAQVYDAQSYGETEAYAREQALSHLASSLYVRIESESLSVADSESGLSSKTTTKAMTNLPILGAQVDCYPKGPEFTCHALLDSATAAPLYREKLLRLDQQIQANVASLTLLTQQVREQTLIKSMGEIDEWALNYEVLSLISPADTQGLYLSVRKSVLLDQLSASQKQAESLEYAAAQLTQKLALNNIYLFPATMGSSKEITPFAQQLKFQMEASLSGKLAQLSRADYIYRGEYLENAKGLLVRYSLSDREGRVVQSRATQLSPNAYQHLSIKPQLMDFDRLLHSGYAVSSDFSVQVRTNRGMRDLAFSAGETVELYIKVNQPGYFYLIGHTKSASEEKSYLLDLQDGPGNRKFIQYVNADDANRWMSLGEFEVEPPFGVESLQVIAMKQDPLDVIPNTRFDGDYYIVSDNISKGVAKTRGLVKKKKVSQAKPAEAVLMFTTLPR